MRLLTVFHSKYVAVLRGQMRTLLCDLLVLVSRVLTISHEMISASIPAWASTQ